MIRPRDNDIRFAEFVRIVDGDTFKARIFALPHMRPSVEIVASIRVHNWNAAELDTEEGRHMRLLFEELLRTAGRIDLVVKTMSFERLVCAVYLDDELFAGILTHELLSYRRAKTDAANTGSPNGVVSSQGSGDDSSADGVHQTDNGPDRIRDEDAAAEFKRSISLDRAEGRG